MNVSFLKQDSGSFFEPAQLLEMISHEKEMIFCLY